MYAPAGVKTAKNFPIPERMRAWVLGDPGELKLIEKPVPVPQRAEVLVRIDAVAICATDLDVIASRAAGDGARRAALQQELHAGPRVHGHHRRARAGVDEFGIGERVTVEIHAGCGQCKRCRMGMYTSCLNYGLN